MAKYLAIAFSCLLFLTVKAESQTVPFDSERWEIKATEGKVIDHLGRKSLYLKGGIATVKGSQFVDGVIEFDIAFTGERGFMGAVWRVQDLENYEEFYLRPHQSGNPDANQYQPVFNGVTAWQLYYGEGYSAPVKYDYNQWMHVKILVSGKNAEVYIKDMTTPALFVNEQKREINTGRVGLNVGDFAPAYYSNFKFAALSSVQLKGSAKTPAPAPAGTVMSWMISSAFEGKSLEKKYQLTPADKQTLSWQKLDCESTGLANLARLQGLKGGRNTVFARLTIHSDREQVKKIRFGFSDNLKAYFNDRLVYGGGDAYQSRDYRFLGTLGLFDELYLPLKKGENELWMAVTESFGGWGIKALIEDMEGIKLTQLLAVDLEKEKAELLRLHKTAREAHFRTDANLLLMDSPEEFITVNDGKINRIIKADERTQFEEYFKGAKYFEWDDLEEPVVRISKDGSMAWMITRIKVKRTQKDTAGAEKERSFIYAGIMTFEKKAGKWVRVANVSTFERFN